MEACSSFELAIARLGKISQLVKCESTGLMLDFDA